MTGDVFLQWNSKNGIIFPIIGKGIMCPLYKSGSLKDPNNFRGISLIDVLNKNPTALMHERIYKWAELNNKIEKNPVLEMVTLLLIICLFKCH